MLLKPLGDQLRTLGIAYILTIQIAALQGMVDQKQQAVGTPFSSDCQIEGPITTVQWSLEGLPLPNNVQTDNTGELKIAEVQPDNEGLYKCSANGGEFVGATQINLTVLGVPSFIGCNSDNCNTGAQITVTEGDEIKIDISLAFSEGGQRGINQEISFAKLYRSDEPINTLVYCPTNRLDGDCINKPNRTSYVGRQIPWNNISFAITNSVVDDSGVYEILLKRRNPNRSSTTTMTSTVTVLVTTRTSTDIAFSTSLVPTPTTTLHSRASSTQQSSTGIVTVSDIIAVSSSSTAVSSSLMSTTSTEENGGDFKLPQAATIAIVCISVMAMLVLVMLIGTMVVVLYRNHRTSQESEYKKSSAGQVIYETVIAQTVSDLRLDFTLNSKHGDI